MGCNCKGSNDFEYNEKTSDMSIAQNIIKYAIKSLAFSIALLFLPIIMLGVIWFLFDIIVLNKNVDLGRIVKLVAKNIKKFNEGYDEDEDDDEDEDYEDEDEFNEENYVTVNVEDITDKMK